MSSRIPLKLQGTTVKGRLRLSEVPAAAYTQLAPLANRGYSSRKILLWYNVVLEQQREPTKLVASDGIGAVRDSGREPSVVDQAMIARDLKPFACHRCETRFKLEKDLVRHIQETCEPWRKWQCPHCPKIFSRAYKYRVHLRQEHFDLPNKRAGDATAVVLIAQEPVITCGFCIQEFSANVDDGFAHHEFTKHLTQHYQDGKIKSLDWNFTTQTTSSSTISVADKLCRPTVPSPAFSPLTLPADLGERRGRFNWGEPMLSGFDARPNNAIDGNNLDHDGLSFDLNHADAASAASATLVAPEDFEMTEDPFEWNAAADLSKDCFSHDPAGLPGLGGGICSGAWESFNYQPGTNDGMFRPTLEVSQVEPTAADVCSLDERFHLANGRDLTLPYHTPYFTPSTSYLSSKIEEVDLPKVFLEHQMPPYNPTPPVQYPDQKRHKRGISGTILSMFQNVSGFPPFN